MQLTPRRASWALLASVLLGVPVTSAFAQQNRPIEFNRDVRPILSDACFQCHGPDNAKRKAGLRFDTEDGARIDLGGHFAIVPGKPGESELIKRITTADKRKRMPPPSSSVTLTAKQMDILRQWIQEGAKWQKHWAFLPPRRSALPAVKDKAWPRNGIDYFVLARLEAEGLKPAPEADPATLIRRVTLDLTGLPPTVKEVDEFLRDCASAKPQAYEALVDRLLKSPRHGEHMARRWIDLARYADTNGYQTDGERVMWRWRDWVIDAFNTNMPFDRFTIEQIAGDMLPNATLDQKIATGFNRNHRGNSEGGVIPEEYAVEYVVDRVDTTATVWLGLTAGCARCHDHKYDPLTQREFYQLFAYFNNVPERGKAIKYGNSPPYIKSPTREQQWELNELEATLAKIKQRFVKDLPKLERAQAEWERTLAAQAPVEWEYTRDQTVSAQLEEGRSFLDAGDEADFGFFDKFSMGARIKPANADAGPILSRMVDTDRADGYLLAMQNGRIHVQLVKRWLDDAIRIETIEALKPNEWHHVFFTYDGSREAKGVKIYVNGQPAGVKVILDDLNQNFRTKEPLRIGGGGGKRFRGSIDDVRVFDAVVAPQDVAILANTDAIPAIVRIAPERRTPAQAHKLRSYFLEELAPAEIRQTHRKLLKAERELEHFDSLLPTTMVMQEMPTARDTHILLRGEYDKKGVKVAPSTPAALPPMPKGMPNNRLGLAYWLVSPINPLTARVTVNRHWQMLFGAGIVRTVEDFGAQGDWPSHPELLDWLALQFSGVAATPGGAANPWDTRHILKLIVSSATYRQSSRVTPAQVQRDPDNRLLARGPRFRLSAEAIRDQALFASGLLVEKLGGPSVRPYQPAGLVKELTGTEEYEQDHGEKLYRRSLYTFWKRTVAPPTMMSFDAANRETCVVRESRTNTPLQALNLLNDVTFVESARVMAERVMKWEKEPAPRLVLAWRLATSRSPNPAELAILRDALTRHHAHYRLNLAAAAKLVHAGEAPRDRSLDVAEHAAYSAVCNLILNLDEVITKE